MRTAAFATTALVMTGVLFAPGCSSPEPSRVSIGLSTWPGFEVVHVAEELGYFEAEGLRVHMVEQFSTGDTRRSYERGQLDVWCGSGAEVLFACANGARSPRIVMAIDAATDADVLVADRRIASIRELRGKRVALEPASLDVVAMHHTLASAGLTFRDIQVVGMSQASVPRALAERTVVAAQMYPPISLRVLADSSRFHMLTESRPTSNRIFDVLAMDSTFLERHPARARGIVRALGRAEAYIRSHREEMLVEIADRNGLSRQDLERALQGIRPYRVDEQARLLQPGGEVARSLRSVADALRATGALDSVPPVDSLVTPDLARDVIEARQ